MPSHCYQKAGSDPPVCGLHNVRLVSSKIEVDVNHPGLIIIDCYRCPKSGMVVKELDKWC